MRSASRVVGKASLLLATAALCLGATPALADTTENASKSPHERINPIKPPRDLCPGPVVPEPMVRPLYCDIVLPPTPPRIPRPIQPPILEPKAEATAVAAVSVTSRTVPYPPWPHPSPWPEPWPTPSPWPTPWPPSPWPGPTFPVEMMQASHALDNAEPGMPIPRGIGDNKGSNGPGTLNA